MQLSFLQLIIIIVAISFSCVLICRKLHLPSILGYLITGIIIGDSGLEFFHINHNIKLLAEIGVAFMLFSIGLEMSFEKLLQQRKNFLVVGSSQVIICTVFPAIAAYYLGMTMQGAIIAAAAVAMSSTAIITRQLSEQHEFNTTYGHLSLAILLFQDLIVVPFFIIIPALADTGISHKVLMYKVIYILVKGFIAVFIMVFAGRKILPVIYNAIAKNKSNEIFMLTTLSVVLIAALITDSFNLSFALGAFLAGVILGESTYLEQIEKDIRPFKDVLLGLFFITVGAQLNLSVILQYWYWVLFLVVMVVSFKAIAISMLALMLTRMAPTNSLKTGIILAHSGEFSFAILTLAIYYNVIQADYGQVVLMGVIITMFLAVLMVSFHNEIANFFARRLFKASGAD